LYSLSFSNAARQLLNKKARKEGKSNPKERKGPKESRGQKE
jgi:hypothetical protein